MNGLIILTGLAVMSFLFGGLGGLLVPPLMRWFGALLTAPAGTRATVAQYVQEELELHGLHKPARKRGSGK